MPTEVPETQEDLETQPLIEKKNDPSLKFFQHIFSARPDAKRQELLEDEDWDGTCYDITKLPTWASFTMVKGCAWDNKGLWIGTACSFVISLSVVTISLVWPGLVVGNPETLQNLATFLKFFVGALLGFFLSSSMNRWFACSNAFMQLLDAVRSMQMQLIALGVRQEQSETINRYGVLSAWLLHLNLNRELDLHNTTDVQSRHVAEKERIECMWQQLWKHRPNIVKPAEKRLLMQYSDASALLWTWVASLVGRMAKDGEIPPAVSPTYGRILDIVQQAYGCIRSLRTIKDVNAPITYIHSLVILVHVNNILNALSFGFVLSIAIAESSEQSTSHWRFDIGLFTSFCLSILGPTLYLALLEVAVCVSNPFAFTEAKIPTVRFIKSLEEDMKNAAAVADKVLGWEKPAFKGPKQ